MSISPVHVFIATAFCIVAATAPRGTLAAEASGLASLNGREPFEFTYRFDSADLRTPSGTQRLYRNLVRQAQRACSENLASLLDLKRLDRHCATALTNDVVQRIGSPALAALNAKSAAANGFAATSRNREFVGSL